RLDGEGDGLDEAGDDGGVQRVGLGELAGGLGVVPDALGLDDGDLDAGLLEGECDGQLEPAGGLKPDADVGRRGGEGAERLDELAVPGRGVIDAQGFAGRLDADVEVGLRDVDTDEEGGHGGTVAGDRVSDRDRPELVLANTGSGPR